MALQHVLILFELYIYIYMYGVSSRAQAFVVLLSSNSGPKLARTWNPNETKIIDLQAVIPAIVDLDGPLTATSD